MFGLGTKELIVIAVILIVLFGAKKIPELARGIGKAVRHIRGGFNEDDANAQEIEKNDSTK